MKAAKNEQGVPFSGNSSGLGVLLLGPSFTPIYANPDVVQLLAYPESPDQVGALNRFLTKKLQSVLGSGYGSPRAASEFQSGRRHYRCQVFAVESRSKDPSYATVVLFERGPRGPVGVAQVAEEFHLTERERETAALLVEGLSTKDIAARMNISPNTVKAFVRLVMIKTGVSTRAEVVGKIIKARP